MNMNNRGSKIVLSLIRSDILMYIRFDSCTMLYFVSVRWRSNNTLTVIIYTYNYGLYIVIYRSRFRMGIIIIVFFNLYCIGTSNLTL